MPLHPTWQEIAVRLLLTVVTGAIIGLDRGEHGRPAGMRTTLLVCLAASVSMILANLLLATDGKTSESFATADVLRLPLGILSGMGFIGAAAVVRRGDLILGVTTAATLWFVTVMGLCFGGGANGLGLATFVLGLLVLTVMKRWEKTMRVEHHARLMLETTDRGPTEESVDTLMRAAGYRADSWSVTYRDQAKVRVLRCRVRWSGDSRPYPTPGFIEVLARNDEVTVVDWRP